ncbi:MAG: hypothetical protein Q7J57_14920 [Gemmobacter sp.]|nr:hypothetical protein [Gemmobacter sp.]
MADTGLHLAPYVSLNGRKGQNGLTLADGRNWGLVLDCKKSGCGFLDILTAAGLRAGDYVPPDPATIAQREREARALAEKRAAQLPFAR